MVQITNLTSLKRKLEKLQDRYSSPGEELSVVVGYTANYGVYVHERQAKHAPPTQWKFLEQPARQLSGVLGRTVVQALASNIRMLQALYLAGLQLQRESQLIVPVDTGNLRGSAFTAREKDLQAAMAASEAKFQAGIGKAAKKKAKERTKKQAKASKQKFAKSVKALKVSMKAAHRRAKKVLKKNKG